MAGAYKHLIGSDGTFTMDLIENMGDAEEALEECYIMISQLQDTVVRLQAADSPKPTYNSASTKLAIELSKIVHNKCKDVPHDI